MPTIDLSNLDPSLILLILIACSALVLLLIVATLISKAAGRSRHRTTPAAGAPEGPLPYQPVAEVLTPAERSFYRCLQQAVGDDLDVFPKMRLADIFRVTAPKGQYVKYFNMISAKHADFLLCDARTGCPRLIVELDDASHKQRRRRERDAFLDRLCADAGLPILHQPAQMAYDTKDLRQSIIDTITDPKSDPKDS